MARLGRAITKLVRTFVRPPRVPTPAIETWNEIQM